jgi:hypothetical protein
MIFAIYRGLVDEPDNGLGHFTKGRLYLAAPEVDDKVVVDVNHLQMKDDTGQQVWVDPENNRFEYPDEVYGVIVKALGPRTPGEVVVVTSADDGGEFLEIDGMGFIRAANLQLLDSTVVKPGMMVFDRSRGRWDRIRKVDECMRLCVEAADEMRDCADFIFAVSDEDLTTVPLLRCLDDTGRDNIKSGSIYRVCGLDDAGLLLVEDDEGNEASFSRKSSELPNGSKSI